MSAKTTKYYHLNVNSPQATQSAALSQPADAWETDQNFYSLDDILHDIAESAGSSISVNGTPVASANLNSTSPEPPSGYVNIVWAYEGSAVSAYAPAGFLNPMLDAGDLIYEDSSLGPARLPIGTSGEVLTVVGGLPVWAAGSQAVVSVFSRTGAVVAGANDYAAVPNLVLGDGNEDSISISDGILTISVASGSTIYMDANSVPEIYLLAQGGSGLDLTLETASLESPDTASTVDVSDSGVLLQSASGTITLDKSPANSDNSTKIATTAYVKDQANNFDAAGAAVTAQTNAESFATSAVATETSRAEAAEALLAPKASPTFTGTVSGITAAMVGADASGAAATAQANAESFATSAVATETSRAEAEEAMLASIISGLGSEFLALAGGTMSGTINMNENLIVWENSSLGIDTSLSRVGPGILGIGTGANGSSNGTLDLGSLNVSGISTFGGSGTTTITTQAPGTSPATAGFRLLQNTTPTVTGASTTVALSTSAGPINVSGNTWRYTLAATETGAGSGAWVNASVTVSGYTGGATGNNGTFIITASTTTTFDVVNASGTTTRAGTPVAISSAVVNSPIIQLAGTVNTGTAGTLNSAADTWSIQNVISSVVPNPISTLTITHSGSLGQALTKLQAAGALEMWLGSTAGSAGICTGINGANTLSIGSGTGTATLFANFSTSGIQAPTAGLFGWSNSNGSSTLDTGISRSSAGVVAIGTGAPASAAGSLLCSAIALNGATNEGAGTINLATYYAAGVAGASASSGVYNTFTFSGGICTAVSDVVSDERLKNFSPYVGGLKEILAITPIKYTYNEAGQQHTGLAGEIEHVGFSAQNIQKVIPQAVAPSTLNPEYLTLDERPVIAALANAVKELHAIIQQMRAEIKKLKEE